MQKIIAGAHPAAGGGGEQRGDGVGRVQRHAALLRPRGATPLHHLGQAQVSLYLDSRIRMSISQERIKYHDYYKDNHFNLLSSHWHHTVCFIAIVTFDVQLPILSGTIQ